MVLQKRSIAFLSHVLKGKNLLLSMYEKEILAMVVAIQKWHSYLIGRQFVVRFDQRSLKYLWEQRITTSAQQRWLFKLMHYDFIIEYRKGKENVVTYALSRREEIGGKKGELTTTNLLLYL
ncbi:hypothetical protein Pint_20738 [Pistacia integerrima]|uniref:Uncharacterized protein n=1 Tax=Pistacia integerrima TaxID=434235 RepID=A0ACC0XEN7_9ROSI|nr:hypothetical protein Pint_20738 [Pistacia integerrima]